MWPVLNHKMAEEVLVHPKARRTLGRCLNGSGHGLFEEVIGFVKKLVQNAVEERRGACEKMCPGNGQDVPSPPQHTSHGSRTTPMITVDTIDQPYAVSEDQFRRVR